MTLVRRLPPLPTTRDILRMYGIKAKKKLSQNFLLDPRILDKVARSAGNLKGKTVVEVGPGPGGITRAIIANGAKEVHVVEKDARFLPSLQLLQEACGNVLQINLGDVLHFNMSKLFPVDLKKDWQDSPPDIRLIGNLPFNIATPLLMKYLRSMSMKDNLFTYGRVPLLLTFQHEVAHRMIAPPNDPERCRLSLICQNYAQIRYKFQLSGGSFHPAPKVDVGVVSILPLKKPYVDLPFHFVERVSTALFRGKQKNIKNSVKNLFPDNMNQKRNCMELLGMAGIKYDRIPISLDMNEFENLSFAFKDMCDRDPVIQNYISSDCMKMTLAYQEQNGFFLNSGEEEDNANEYLQLEETKF